MRKFLMCITAFAFWPAGVLAASTSSTATVAAINPETLDTVGEGIELFQLMVNAFQSKDWTLVAAFLLMLIVAALRFFAVGRKIPKPYLPWFVGAVAMAASIAVGLQAGLGWKAIVTTGLTVGLTAMGGWSTFGKLLKSLLAKVAPKIHDKFWPKEPPPLPPEEEAKA